MIESHQNRIDEMTDGEADTIIFRPHCDDDIPFIMDSWAASYLTGSRAHRNLTAEEFHSFHRPQRLRFFAKPSATVIIAAPCDDPWLILGWIAVEKIPSGLICQYLYVKSAFKTQGIAADLIKRAIPTAPVFYTHMTDRAARIMAGKQAQFSTWKHIPHLV